MTLQPKQEKDLWSGWEHLGRKLLCTKCGYTMPDGESATEAGEFYHPRNGCTNGDKTYRWEFAGRRCYVAVKGEDGTKSLVRVPSKERVHGIQQLLPKKYRRERKRGAKLASKHRGARK